MNEFCRNYLELINSEFSGLNLTRITDQDEFYNKQYLDSVKPFEEIPLLRDTLQDKRILVDLGCGGGFPILPLSSVHEDVKFVGIDSKRKKLDAVEKISETTSFGNVVTRHMRFEKLNFDVDCVVTCKAVGKIQDILPKLNVNADCTFVFYKGPNLKNQELTYDKINNWQIVGEKEISIPGTDGRLIVIYKKIVPRGTNTKGELLSKILGDSAND